MQIVGARAALFDHGFSFVLIQEELKGTIIED